MENTTILFIRACKLENSLERIYKVYQRFYGDYGYLENTKAIVSILANIVDEYTLFSISEYFRRESEYKGYAQISGGDYNELETKCLILRDKIRHTKKDELAKVGFIPSMRWRK